MKHVPLLLLILITFLNGQTLSPRETPTFINSETPTPVPDTNNPTSTTFAITSQTPTSTFNNPTETPSNQPSTFSLTPTTTMFIFTPTETNTLPVTPTGTYAISTNAATPTDLPTQTQTQNLTSPTTQTQPITTNSPTATPTSIPTTTQPPPSFPLIDGELDLSNTPCQQGDFNYSNSCLYATYVNNGLLINSLLKSTYKSRESLIIAPQIRPPVNNSIIATLDFDPQQITINNNFNLIEYWLNEKMSFARCSVGVQKTEEVNIGVKVQSQYNSSYASGGCSIDVKKDAFRLNLLLNYKDGTCTCALTNTDSNVAYCFITTKFNFTMPKMEIVNMVISNSNSDVDYSKPTQVSETIFTIKSAALRGVSDQDAFMMPFVFSSTGKGINATVALAVGIPIVVFFLFCFSTTLIIVLCCSGSKRRKRLKTPKTELQQILVQEMKDGTGGYVEWSEFTSE
ncbi:hypothetical protein AKO1_012394 [Acrasis kona]|uniref:Uncharacterized protein n=1 Tax=Acrasis kona TaxID=1008807 RepID=A0AAW2YYR5_9EUKA